MKKMYEIIIRTNVNTYKEKWYGLIETSNRVLDLMKCDNVEMIDLMCLTTGEILITVNGSAVDYVADEYIARFNLEI